ncbi:MAG: MBG domain-containing protein, partial [Azonexus sp.]
LVVTASDGAGKIRVGSVNTVAAQSYNAGTGGIELNGNVVTLGSAGADIVTFSDPVTLTGNSSITTAGGSGDDIAINQTVNGAFGLTLNAGAAGNVSTSVVIGGSTPLSAFSATGAAVTLGQSVTAGSIFARSTTGNITLNTGTVLTGTGTGNAIELAAGGTASRFINNAGAGALNASNVAGRFLAWSQNPANDMRGGLAYDFKQYNATYGVTPVAQPTGNGFLYSLAPTVTPALTGTVSKVYDATTSAPLVAANFTLASGVDGDLIALSGTGAYDNPNVAGSPTKLVTATGIAATVTSSVADGSKPVYGYTLTSTTASANIGEITPAPLTVTGDTTSSVYTATAQTNTFTTSGLLGSDSVTSVATLASGTSVGTYADNLTSATGTGLANYTIGYVNGNLTITPAPLTITGDTTSSLYTSNLQTNTFTTSGLLGSDTVTSVATLASGTNVGTYADTLTSASGSGLSNYTIGYVNGSLSIAPATLTITGDTTNSVYTSNVQTNTFSTTGLLGSDTVTSVATLASGTNVGTYADTLTSASGSGLSNYTIGYVNGSLSITPAALVITADDASRPVNTSNPQFTATYAGFVGGETPAVLNGVLAFSTPATLISPVGIYSITPYGQSSGNYTVTYRDGILTIQAVPVVTLPFPREVVSQQAIGAQYTDPTQSSEALTGLQFTFEDEHDGKDEKVAASMVRVIGFGIKLPN